MSKEQFEKISLKKFKINEMMPNATILIYGRRRTGKSFLTRDIFFHHRNIPYGLIFSGTEDANPFYSNFIPDSFIHSKYDSSLVETVLEKQGRKIREARKTYDGKNTNGCLPKNRFFLVLDDMLQDSNQWKRENTIKSIFYNGRHYNIFFILAMQYPYGIGPDLRSNIDYVFIFNEPSYKNRKKLFDDYGACCINNFDNFCMVLDSTTQDHGCLVLKLSGTSPNLRDQIFWYKAEQHDNFKVGHPKIWEYHENNYNKKYIDEKFSEEERIKKKYAKNKLKVIVSKAGDIIDVEQEDE